MIIVVSVSCNVQFSYLFPVVLCLIFASWFAVDVLLERMLTIVWVLTTHSLYNCHSVALLCFNDRLLTVFNSSLVKVTLE